MLHKLNLAWKMDKQLTLQGRIQNKQTVYIGIVCLFNKAQLSTKKKCQRFIYPKHFSRNVT